jgi:hypothetical protein
MHYLEIFLKEYLIETNIGIHSIFWIPIHIFNQLPIKRWKFNRPPDIDRVYEINECMKKTGHIDGIIYIALIDNELVCYESNHRREALKGLENIKHILVDIIWNATDDIIKQEFIRLNKAVCVPELYIDKTIEIDLDKLRIAVDDFCKLYKCHKVTSGKPNRPNFNRDNLTDDLYLILKENKISLEELLLKLTDYNKKLLLKDKTKLSEKIIEKCTASGLWLFAWNSRLVSKDIFD